MSLHGDIPAAVSGGMILGVVAGWADSWFGQDTMMVSNKMQQAFDEDPIEFVEEGTACDYNFTLTPPLMNEFADAANAYGRHWQLFCMLFICVFCGGECIVIINGRYHYQNMAGFIILLLMALVMVWMVVSRRARHFVLMPWMLPALPSWFSGCAASRSRRQAYKVVFGIGPDSLVQGPRWCTPCRVSVSEGGVHMVRWVSDRVYEDGCPWEQVECVRVTPHAIVLGPSAWSKTHTIRLDGYSVTAGDVNNCVIIPKECVGSVAQFVADCWARVLAMHPALRRPMSRRVRFRRWFHGDDL
ncbi:hypothetical protein OZX74_04065 [Bifidobacterium sp. ESL0798]|uniref:hypothetical protein n=1 Tax=Bifidobacterium sp. ESL0798 TaxID=2983235 RepID=UPI0023F7E5EB|nr:hypothetical protein [Bifidobacterium sp. ESL0798]WEV74701.1 hypothetical protein OZX74_04065 [Bifidobacterium sp. ESL0798]